MTTATVYVVEVADGRVLFAAQCRMEPVMTTLVLTAVATFIIGLLMGDRRAVMHFNAEIDRRNAELERMILEVSGQLPEPAEDEARSSLH
jgi:hypothetical protein